MAQIELEVVNHLTQKIVDDHLLQQHCDAIARDQSKTHDIDLTTIEDTPPHDLYWSIYTLTQMRILAKVISKLSM